MTLDEFLRVGETVDIGTHTFDPESIKAFARKYDPQPFHVDAELAKQSVFGGLCASGWHTAAAWMKCNIETEAVTPAWQGPGPKPEFGPSPGFRNLKWLKPVFAGETVRYTRKVLNHRPLATRPGWHVMTIWGEGHDSTGDKVLEFESAALVKAA
ncbi:MAG TPA: MaoC family dehydratase [Mesorhizobium sp.]|jgi:acyl dehydratase